MSENREGVALSANSRQLFSEHHVEHSGTTNFSFHQNHSGMFGNHFADDAGVRLRVDEYASAPRTRSAASGATMANSFPSLAT